MTTTGASLTAGDPAREPELTNVVGILPGSPPVAFHRWNQSPVSPPGARPASRNAEEMKSAAASSPFDPNPRPSSSGEESLRTVSIIRSVEIHSGWMTAPGAAAVPDGGTAASVDGAASPALRAV